ncbi:MAG: response regulator transcription factor [Candidatus Azobacteroides sp.]|nr:response regulator transcription factor [Candidatus Azobacteroides sp.]
MNKSWSVFSPEVTYILADNQDITHDGMTFLLHQQNKKSPIITATTCNELQEKLKFYPESVVILDYTLFDYSSVYQFLNMRAGAKESSWLLFSDELGEIFLRRILLSDSSISVVMKQDKREEIIKALQTVSAGGVFLCETAKSVLGGDMPKRAEPDKLTATEKLILREIALGKMTKEIAWEKNLSFHTINTHRRNIFRKLGVNNAHEATKYALQAGLVDVLEYYI